MTGPLAALLGSAAARALPASLAPTAAHAVRTARSPGCDLFRKLAFCRVVPRCAGQLAGRRTRFGRTARIGSRIVFAMADHCAGRRRGRLAIGRRARSVAIPIARPRVSHTVSLPYPCEARTETSVLLRGLAETGKG